MSLRKHFEEISGQDLTNIQCLYCMDSKLCRICQGDGLVPTWNSETGKFNVYGGRIQCWNCKGHRGCPQCSAKAL